MAAAHAQNESVEDLLNLISSIALELKESQSAADGNSLTFGGWQVLKCLAETGEQSVPQIGRRKGTSRQNIQIIVNALHSKGQVEFLPNPAHKRSALVRVTEAGEQALIEVDRGKNETQAHILNSLTRKEIDSALDVLRKLEDCLEEQRVDPVIQKPSPVKVPKSRQAKDNHSNIQEPKSAEPELLEDEIPINLL